MTEQVGVEGVQVDSQDSPSPSAPQTDEQTTFDHARAALQAHSIITNGAFTGCCAGCLAMFNHIKPWPCTVTSWARKVVEADSTQTPERGRNNVDSGSQSEPDGEGDLVDDDDSDVRAVVAGARTSEVDP